MKRNPIYLVTSLILLAFTGCEQLRYAQYSGEHKNWPTGASFSDMVFAVPVYRGWPEKLYDVMGYIEFNKPGIDWNEGDIKDATKKAREVGGDAILMVPKNDVTSPTLAMIRKDLGLTGKETAAVVLKWK